jgi:hypothetical protein
MPEACPSSGVQVNFSPSNIPHTSGYAYFANTFRNQHITQTAKAVYYKLFVVSGFSRLNIARISKHAAFSGQSPGIITSIGPLKFTRLRRAVPYKPSRGVPVLWRTDKSLPGSKHLSVSIRVNLARKRYGVRRVSRVCGRIAALVFIVDSVFLLPQSRTGRASIFCC